MTMILTNNTPYASDAPVRFDLPDLAHASMHAFGNEDGTPRSKRARVRYLAALLPDLSIPQLAEALHGVLANNDLSVGDLRVILDGRLLNDPSKSTNEVPVTAIQRAGRLLSAGTNRLTVARETGISVDTVTAIDEYLGLTERYEERLMDTAIIAVREGWSVRDTARNTGISKSRAHRYLTRARAVLVELGEVSA